MRKISACYLMVVMLLFSSTVFARMTLIEKLEANFKADSAFSDKEREAYLEEFRLQLGSYAFDIMKEQQMKGADIAMSIIIEGSFGQIPIARSVTVAKTAYIAISRGAPPDAVRGIALYGFRKKVEADKIEAWANGYHLCMRHGVPQGSVQELVFAAAEFGWNLDTFNDYKWALVRAKKAGFNTDKYVVYLIGHHLKKTARSGALIKRANKEFKASGKKGPKLPAYQSAVVQVGPKPKKPKPKKPEPKKPEPKKPEPKKPEPKKPEPKKPEPKKPEPKKPEPKQPEAKGSLSHIWNQMQASIASFIGTPYVWGGCTRRGTDCSGFTQTVYDESGIALPRNSMQQWQQGRKIPFKKLKNGDLVFFITIGKRISHVGIVTDGDKKKFTHASSSRGVVGSDLKSKYYMKRYAGARRVIR